jgi:DNA-directed RNA polymerase specialized sigma24 family protein
MTSIEQCYRKAVDDLPPLTRRAFLMHRIQAFSYAEIAKPCAIRVEEVERHISYALCNLDDAMMRYENGPIRRAWARAMLAKSEAAQRRWHRAWCRLWRLIHWRSWSATQPLQEDGAAALERFIVSILPFRQRIVFNLERRAGKRMVEIAMLCDVSVSTAEDWMHQALRSANEAWRLDYDVWRQGMQQVASLP